MMPMSAIADDPPDALCSSTATGAVVDANGRPQSVTWQLPVETPVAIQINSEPFTVMMASPANLRDFAMGLLLGEGIIADAAAVQGVLVMPVDGGLTLDVAIQDADFNRDRIGRRSIEGRSGCGLCGVADIDQALRPLRRLDRTGRPSDHAILQASAELKQRQPMNRLNRSVHAAAFANSSGEILVVREDVGRHNALDKLIGALARSPDVSAEARRSGFVVITSRCSFELVQKTVTAGLSALVSVSAPTSLALDLARDANLFLAALGPSGVVVFQS